MMVQCPEQVRHGYIRFMTPEQNQLVEQKRQQQMQEEGADNIRKQYMKQLEEYGKQTREQHDEMRKQHDEMLENWRKQQEEIMKLVEESGNEQNKEITKQHEESRNQYEESRNRDGKLYEENKTPQQGGATDTTERNQVLSPFFLTERCCAQQAQRKMLICKEYRRMWPQRHQHRQPLPVRP